MRRPRRMPAKQPILSAASLCVVAVLPGCSAVSSSADPPVPATAHSAVPSTVHSTKPALAFTVAGVRPVLPSGSQDTHAQTPAASCDSATFAADKALGDRVFHGFALAGSPLRLICWRTSSRGREPGSISGPGRRSRRRRWPAALSGR